MGAIVDEPIGTVGQPGAIEQETPGGAVGVGGVIGGGGAIGPDGSEVTPVASNPSPAPDEPIGGDSAPTAAAPTATTPAIPQPSPTPSQTSGPPSPSPFSSPPGAPTATAQLAPQPGSAAIRLDEPVLRFLPEITAAADVTGIPASILAAVVRVESNGDSNLIANGSRIGWTGVPGAGLANQRVAPSAANDPAANLLAGAGVLAALSGSTGSWDAALLSYFGGDCDASGVCPGDYRYDVHAWATFCATAVSNPDASGFTVLPSTWTPPPLATYQGSSPRPIPLPPGVAAPTATPHPTEPPLPTALPTETPVTSGASDESAIEVPSESAVPPTEPPTPTVATTANSTSTPSP